LRFRELPDGGVIFHCFAGCTRQAILRALGVEEGAPDPARAAALITRYEIRDHEGRLLAVHLRQDLLGGRKRMWWQTPDGRRGLGGLRPVDLLYGLERLSGAQEVVVTEGEKCADALRSGGIAAVATVCGAAATPSDQVLRHLVRPGLRVILWPDADEAGRRHMQKIAERLHRLGGRDLRIVEPPAGVPAGWDGADAVAEGRDVRALLAAARPWAPPARPRLFRPAAELTAPPVEWTCRELVPAGMLTVVSGRDKRGKTLLALELVRAVLTGQPFLGHFPVRQGPVVAAFLDDPLAVTLERLEALGIRHHPDLYLVDPHQATDPRAVLRALEEEARERRAALAVFDALYHLLPSGREALNDAATMRPLMLHLDGIAARSGAGLVVVAHDTKSGGDVAGSFVVRAAAKAILRLTLPPAEEGETSDEEPATPRRHLRLESKLGAAQVWVLELEGPGRWHLLGTAREAREADLRAAILEFVAAHPGATLSEVLREVRGDRTRKLAVVHQLEAEGVLGREGTGRRGDPARFVLAGPYRGPRTQNESAETQTGRGFIRSGGVQNESWVQNESQNESDPALELAQALPGPGVTDPGALARVSADLLGPQVDRSAPEPDAPAPRCAACGGRRWWKRPPSHGGGWTCGRCHPPRGVQPVAWHGPEADPAPRQP
jgi:hypothetical protein